jgi:lipoprotein-anchoring transpeptidase ErfK/SrfK
MSSMMMTNEDGWSTVASNKKGSKHTAMAPHLPPIAAHKSRATKLTFSEMQEELETPVHVAVNVAPSAREIRKEAARAAEKAAPTTTSSYVQFPTLSSNSAAASVQKPKLDFRAAAVAAASKPTPTPTPTPSATATATEALPFILRSTVPVGPDRIVWVEEGYGTGYGGGYELDERDYDLEPMWEEDENGDEYITDERAAFNSRRYGDNSDW